MHQVAQKAIASIYLGNDSLTFVHEEHNHTQELTGNNKHMHHINNQYLTKESMTNAWLNMKHTSDSNGVVSCANIFAIIGV